MTELPESPTFFELAQQALSSTVAGYDLLAPKFESTDYATPLPWIQACLSWVEDKYPIRDNSDSRGADLACGTGRGCRVLRQFCETVDGFDFSDGMLREAQRLSKDTSGLHWLKDDLATISLEPDSYDRIVTFGAWGHILPDFRQRLLQQIVGALKPGGVFVTLTADDAKPWQRRYWFTLLFDLAIRIRNHIWFQEFHMYYRLNSTRQLKEFMDVVGQGGGTLSLEPLPRYPNKVVTLMTYQRKPNG
jgi:SAM-dependent methyltransferase